MGKQSSNHNNLHWQIIEQMHGKFNNTEGMTIGGYLNHPLSVGTLRLRSAKPSDTPLIDPHYLEHPDDMKSILYGYFVTFIINIFLL